MKFRGSPDEIFVRFSADWSSGEFVPAGDEMAGLGSVAGGDMNSV